MRTIHIHWVNNTIALWASRHKRRDEEQYRHHNTKEDKERTLKERTLILQPIHESLPPRSWVPIWAVMW